MNLDKKTKSKEIEEELMRLKKIYFENSDPYLKEKEKIEARAMKITEGDIMKALDYLGVIPKPKITEIREMIWVNYYFSLITGN